MNDDKRILIASGGTGGHIFPAVVFGKGLQDKGADVIWLCGSRKLERDIYNASGIEPVILPLEGSPLGTKSIIKILGRIIGLFRSFTQTLRYIKNFKPNEIYVFGGYVSFAPLILGKLKHIPVTLHEQNAAAGLVTRIASRIGARIITGWPECYGIRDFEYTGIPVREPVRLPRHEALKSLGLNLDVNAKIVCIAGGSLGSGPLSELMTRTAELCPEYEFVFLSSKEKQDINNRHYILPQWDTNPFYSVSDVLVCRAGGSTLAEAMKWGMPTISIPWPGAAENHQVRNSLEFVKIYPKGQMFNESDTPENLAVMIRSLLI